MRRSLLYIPVICVVLGLVIIICTLLGPAGLPYPGFAGNSSVSTIVYDVRLPRIMAALLVGMGLATAGAVMQGLFRNPMADPYLLGTSFGGSVGAAISITILGGAFQLVLAFAGCLGASFLVYGLSRRGRVVPVEQLLLTGIAVSMFLNAILSFLMYSAGKSLHQIFMWLMGGFWTTSWNDVYIGLIIIPACLVVLLFSRELNIYSVSEEDALHLGVDTEFLKKCLLFAVSLITGVAVTIAGCIGFIGLITPHMVRILVGPDHRILIPTAMLAGGILLIVSDTLARTVGNEVPVGVITAFFGAPFFILLLKRRTGL